MTLHTWGRLLKKAGIVDLHFHDLRRYFNKEVLRNQLSLTPEEAGWYIGNSGETNLKHYSPIVEETMDLKISQLGTPQFLKVTEK